MTKVDRDQIILLFALTESARALKALDEIKRLSKIRVERAPGVVVRENQSVFDQIRLALQFSANVSKIFWPHKNAADRGERLRKLAELPEQHALSDRRLRNHIEHMDERLDDWTADSPRPFLTHELVLEDDERPPEMREEVMQATAVLFNPTTYSVYLFGEVFPLDDLKGAVQDVQDHASKALGTFWK